MTKITSKQIEALRTEAGHAGDDAQIDLCNRALAGDDEARAACAAAIDDGARAAIVREEGNGFPNVGDYVPGEGNLWQIKSLGADIRTGAPGQANWIDAVVVPADWDDCPEGAEFPADVVLIPQLRVGARVCGGDEGTEDYDEGTVVAVDSDRVAVSWDSGARTTQAAHLLRSL